MQADQSKTSAVNLGRLAQEESLLLSCYFREQGDFGQPAWGNEADQRAIRQDIERLQSGRGGTGDGAGSVATGGDGVPSAPITATGAVIGGHAAQDGRPATRPGRVGH